MSPKSTISHKSHQTKSSSPKKGAGFAASTYLTWYELMLRMRRFEEKAAQLYGQQKIRGFCHLYIGQEACAAGAVTALKKDDKYITAYRDHALPLALGTPASSVMAELFGKVTGCSKGKGGSMHIFDLDRNFYGGHGIVGAQVPLGTGIAFAELYQKTQNLCITFMGDGAVRQGAFHEALNLAMHLKLPVIFAIENNGYAMGTSVTRTSNVEDLYKLGQAYEMPSEPVDGMSVEAVHLSIEKAALRARKGEGPTLLELRTYRYKGHSMSDPATYRSREEVKDYQQKDPILVLRKTMIDQQISTSEQLDELGHRIKEEIRQAVQFAEESPFPLPSAAFEDVYSSPNYPFVVE